MEVSIPQTSLFATYLTYAGNGFVKAEMIFAYSCAGITSEERSPIGHIIAARIPNRQGI
uniref:Uncharacterized protein n=1 Tax=mine drainage metagenome TaxID=410659 RepID=E6PH34_9ZZZZ